MWAASLREIKKRIRPLFRQERVATNAGLFLGGLLGDEQRKTGWMRAEAAGDPEVRIVDAGQQQRVAIGPAGAALAASELAVEPERRIRGEPDDDDIVDAEVVDVCFSGSPNVVGGIGWQAMGEDVLERHASG